MTENSYMVAIGASAGGLEAINDLFDNMPSETGFSFIIIQHLSPDHRSLMGELLTKHTSMQVFEAEDNMIPKANCIYLIPSRKVITLKNGRLRLEEKIRDHQPNTAIDIFFESLAKDRGDKAIGVVLSGTGTDGTKGIQEIKNNGGIVVVQDPLTAQFDGMPNSAIGSGYADLILSPEMIGDELLEFIREAPLLRSFNELSQHEESLMLEVIDLVYKTTGHDFSNYKRPTTNRRLAKRMAEQNIRSISEYYKYLQANADEIRKLSKEFLLNVTRFFRDEDAFESIKTVVVPNLLSAKEPGDVIKVWTVACSTGEEAYSLAMVFDECMREQNKTDIEVKIFASDISQETIEIASRGIYAEEQVKGVSPDRLKRFFVKEGNFYKIAPALRKLIVFARHDVVKDPPFSKIDLLTCRNMLIYMNPILQKNVLQKLHFAINENGYLFLGPSENIGILKDVMSEVDKKWKLYKCVSKTKVADLESFSSPAGKLIQNQFGVTTKSKNALNSLPEIFQETLTEEYDYAGILIDRDMEVKQALGNFKRFMDFPEGSFHFNLLKLVPSDLSVILGAAIRKSINDNERVVIRNVKVHTAKEVRHISIIVKPYLVQKTYLQPFIFVVLKEEEVVSAKVSNVLLNRDEYISERIEELEKELKDTKENLQALLEEVESSNEELQSSNEEIISSNEELQSTNEELQSLNEELHTVNAEHQLKIKELIEINDDMNNYFRNTEVGQIFLDKNLVIRKFTPVATKQVNLISTDIGRSITDISTNIRNTDFIKDIRQVLRDGQGTEKEITIGNDTIFLMRIVPYLRQNKSMEGVVVNFINVTEIKKIGNILDAVFNSSTSGIIALKANRNEEREIVDFEIISANKAANTLLGLDTELVGKRYDELFGQVDQRIFESYVKVVDSGQTTTFEYLNLKTSRWFDIVGVKMMDGLVITFTDVTDRKLSSEKLAKGYEDLVFTSKQLQHSNDKLEQSNFDLLQFASVASHDLKEPLRKVQVFGNLLKDRVNTKLDEAELNYMDKMIRASGRMQILIDDILTLSRLSKTDTPHSDVDLGEIVRQIVDDLEMTIKEKQAEIVIGQLPVVRGVSGQMHQLFQNLISNAVKFNDAKPVIHVSPINVSAELEREFRIAAKDYYGVSVEDNGIGFDEQYADKIFGIFQRLEKHNYQGTGIGLAIVKKIVDNHGGYIKAKGQPGKGSTFIVLLPKQSKPMTNAEVVDTRSVMSN